MTRDTNLGKYLSFLTATSCNLEVFLYGIHVTIMNHMFYGPKGQPYFSCLIYCKLKAALKKINIRIGCSFLFTKQRRRFPP